LVQPYEDRREENRSVLEQAGSSENAHLGSSVTCNISPVKKLPMNSNLSLKYVEL
jgi:hypothetical protein